MNETLKRPPKWWGRVPDGWKAAIAIGASLSTAFLAGTTSSGILSERKVILESLVTISRNQAAQDSLSLWIICREAASDVTTAAPQARPCRVWIRQSRWAPLFDDFLNDRVAR